MNYRQWKKAYKKEHGYNPPITEDKRKQRKRQAEQIIRVVKSMQLFDKTMNELVNDIRLCFGRVVEIIGEVFKELGEVFKGLGKVMQKENESICK